MLHLCVSGPVYVLDDVEVVLTNREVHFTFTTCIYFCSRNLLRIMVKINSAKSISEIREISIIGVRKRCMRLFRDMYGIKEYYIQKFNINIFFLPFPFPSRT